MPLAYKEDQNMYFTINMATANQLQMNFPEVVPPGDPTWELMDTEFSFPISLQDFTDPESNLKSLPKRANFWMN